DSWVSILLAHGFIMITVAVMFMILNQYESADIFGIQVDIFGHILGKLLGVIYVVYFGLVLVSVLATYIQVVQLFLYPTFPTYLLCILILLLILMQLLEGSGLL